MKKFTSLVILLVCIFILFGCAKENKMQAKVEDTVTTQTNMESSLPNAIIVSEPTASVESVVQTKLDTVNDIEKSNSEAHEVLPQKISQDDWNSARQYIDLPTGLKMSYVEMGDPNGPVLILQHGMTDNNRVWSLSAPAFCEAGFHVYMLDLRGHGYSEEKDGFYTVFQYACDIKAFMDEKKIDKAYMVGHSLGSFTMQAFYLMFPNKCKKVILVASAPLDEKVHTTDMFKYVSSLNENEQISQEFIDKWYANENPVPQDFLNYIKKEAQQLSIKSWKNITGGVAVSSLEAMYPFFNKEIPALLMLGSKDALLPIENGKRLTQLIPHLDSKVYEGTGHNIQYEIPEQFAKDAISWLKDGKIN